MLLAGEPCPGFPERKHPARPRLSHRTDEEEVDQHKQEDRRERPVQQRVQPLQLGLVGPGLDLVLLGELPGLILVVLQVRVLIDPGDELAVSVRGPFAKDGGDGLVAQLDPLDLSLLDVPVDLVAIDLLGASGETGGDQSDEEEDEDDDDDPDERVPRGTRSLVLLGFHVVAVEHVFSLTSLSRAARPAPAPGPGKAPRSPFPTSGRARP